MFARAILHVCAYVRAYGVTVFAWLSDEGVRNSPTGTKIRKEIKRIDESSKSKKDRRKNLPL